MIILKIRVYSRGLGEAFRWFRQLKNQTTTEPTQKTQSPPLARGGWGGLKYETITEQTKKTLLLPPLPRGGLGGVKILYNNDKTLQQNLRKIQATEASHRNDRS